MKTTWGVPLIDALAEAREILTDKRLDCVAFHPAWQKLEHAGEHVRRAQEEAAKELLADPEKSDG